MTFLDDFLEPCKKVLSVPTNTGALVKTEYEEDVGEDEQHEEENMIETSNSITSSILDPAANTL